jgi:hypothetical protein
MENGETVQGEIYHVPGDRAAVGVAGRPVQAEYVTRAELAEVEGRLTARLDAILARLDALLGRFP